MGAGKDAVTVSCLFPSEGDVNSTQSWGALGEHGSAMEVLTTD